MRLVRYRAARAVDTEGAVRSGAIVAVDGVDRVVDLGPGHTDRPARR
ncbi:hypothetical protein QE367_002774 [Microbacterium paludicola]|uniref:Dihydroorotase n=1 Tax=Microbacterium paludicola TaxID=300019 RepID=A0ABU1I4B9_9MICO|nr:hypothetical protein [Microbacterium paludicola]